MNSTDTTIADRLESEREFHNKRFAQEVRQPTHGFYRTVRGAFYRYEERLAVLSRNKDVLEYGCSVGLNALRLAGTTKSITGNDISEVAIAQARAAAEVAGVANASFHTMNAEEMTFADSAFDFVFGSSILHHLDLNRAYGNIARVLRPGGIALFLEPLGHNPLINAYRKRTPSFRTPDEHPLRKSDIEMSRKYFSGFDVRLYGLTTLLAIPLLNTPIANPALAIGQSLDRVVLSIPGIKWHAWFSVIELYK